MRGNPIWLTLSVHTTSSKTEWLHVSYDYYHVARQRMSRNRWLKISTSTSSTTLKHWQGAFRVRSVLAVHSTIYRAKWNCARVMIGSLSIGCVSLAVFHLAWWFTKISSLFDGVARTIKKNSWSHSVFPPKFWCLVIRGLETENSRSNTTQHFWQQTLDSFLSSFFPLHSVVIILTKAKI